jgi:hypothetical protein
MKNQLKRLVPADRRFNRSRNVVMVKFCLPERPRFGVMPVIDGEVAERLKAAVLKTAER